MLKSLKTNLTPENKEAVYLFMHTNKLERNLSQDLHIYRTAFTEYL